MTASLSDASGADTRSDSVAIALRWGDMDANGHINNVTFFRLLEEARLRWLRSREIDVGAFVIAHQCLDYRAALRWSDAPVDVQITVGEIGRSSVHLRQHIVAPNGIPCAEGTVVLVAVDATLHSARPLTGSEVRSLGGVEAEHHRIE